MRLAAARSTRKLSAKYLNSPETPLFHKGATLYNIAAARQAVHNAGKSTQSAHENFSARVIAVEGYVDVIAMVMAGYEGTVAPLGTALTAEQLALMWRLNDEPILCFDGDDAGRRAAYRALDVALPLLKPGKSPVRDAARRPGSGRPRPLRRPRRDRRRARRGAAAGANAVGAREQAGSFDTPERRAALEARIGEVTNAIADETVRRYYRQDFSARLRQMFAPVNISTRRQNFAANRFDDKNRRGGAPPRALSPKAAFGQETFGQET